MREVKVKGKKGAKGPSIQRYGDDLTKLTPRQTTPAIPETEVAQQMVNGVNPEVAGPKYTTTPYPADEGVASIRHQISINNGPATFVDPYFYISKFKPFKKVYLPVPYVPNGKTPFSFNDRAPSPLMVPEIKNQPKSDIDILWDRMKEERVKLEQQLAQKMMEQAVDPEFQSLAFESKYDNPGISDLMIPFADSKGYIPNPAKSYKATENFAPSKNPSTTDLFFPQWLSIPSPSTLLSPPLSPKRQPYTIGEPMSYPGRYPVTVYDGPITSTEKNGSLHSKSLKTPLAALAGLTGLGLAAYPFVTEKEENENINEIPVFTETPQAQTEPTLEQQYANQSIPETDSGIWGEKINKLTHPTLKDFLPNPNIVPLSPLNRENREAFHQPLAVSSNINDLVRNGYKGTPVVSSELPANTSQDTFIAPRELPAKGQTLADYNKNNPPQDVTSGPRVLNVPVEKKAITAKPVQSEDKLTEANLASAMAREAASPQVLQYGSPAYLQKNKPVDMRQWVRQKYGMSMSPAEMVQRGIMPYEYLQYW